MRFLVLLWLAVLLAAAPATAVKLQAVATVELVAPADVRLDPWQPAAPPTWTVTGTADEQVHVSLSVRTADGQVYTVEDGAPAQLDAAGHLTDRLYAPDPHTPVAAVTLVVCRE